MPAKREHTWERNVALAIGVGQVGWTNHHLTDHGNRGQLTVPCSKGHDVEIDMPTKFPSDVIKKKLMRQGWSFQGRKPVCPDCVSARKVTRLRPKTSAPEKLPVDQNDNQPILPEEQEQVPMDTSPTAAAAPITPSARAKAARREVMQWLDESFELTGPEKGRFKGGVTDATIAKETGCSEDAVRKIREEFFGILDRPRELDTISAEVGTLRLAADQLVKDATAQANRLIADATAQAKVIADKADKLSSRLAQISREQGWA